MPDYYHPYNGETFTCPITGKATRQTWTDTKRPGSLNSCEHCSREAQLFGDLLWDLDAQRKAEQRAAGGED
jgi:hypothetical protein